MGLRKKWFYDYADKCDCAEDDKCGCTFPNNMCHDYNYVAELSEDSVRPLQSCVHVGGLAPDFDAPAVMPDNSLNEEFNLYDYITDSYAILFFYPADFSAICPVELISFNKSLAEFNKRNVKIVAVSVDSLHSHLAWKKLPMAQGGIGDVQIPLVSDICKSISFDYGVLSSKGVSMRASFIIDKNYTIRYQVIHDNKIGREVNETLRIIDSLRNLDENGVTCSADIKESMKVMPTTTSKTGVYSTTK